MMEDKEVQKNEVVENVDSQGEEHEVALKDSDIPREENKEVVEKVDPNNEIIQEIMEKVITDPEFKKKLLESPDEVLNQYPLSEITKIMIKSLTEEDYNNLTPENITEYFEADSAIYTPDFDDSIPIEYVDEDDI